MATTQELSRNRLALANRHVIKSLDDLQKRKSKNIVHEQLTKILHGKIKYPDTAWDLADQILKELY